MKPEDMQETDIGNYSVEPNHALIGKFALFSPDDSEGFGAGRQIIRVTRVLYPKDKDVRQFVLQSVVMTGRRKGETIQAIANGNTAFFKTEIGAFDSLLSKGFLPYDESSSQEEDEVEESKSSKSKSDIIGIAMVELGLLVVAFLLGFMLGMVKQENLQKQEAQTTEQVEQADAAPEDNR